MLGLLPPALVVRCSAMLLVAAHSADAGETGACSPDDAVWFSEACRANTSECVPILLQDRLDRVARLAALLNLPLAAAVVAPGAAHYAEYYAAARAGRFLFAYRYPDDTLSDAAGRPPARVRLPPPGGLPVELERLRAEMEGVPLRAYAWRGLAAADRRVAWFATNVAVPAADLGQLLQQTAGLRRAAGGEEAERRAACDWVRANEARWRGWVPAACGGGTYTDSDMSW